MRLYLVERSLLGYVLFSCRVRDRIKFSVRLVSCYAHVFVLHPIVTVTPPRVYRSNRANMQ